MCDLVIPIYGAAVHAIAVRYLLVFSRWRRATASPFTVGGWLMDGRVVAERKLKLGEPVAYQASSHRFGFGVDSAQPPQERAVRDLLAFSRWRRATASSCRMVRLYGWAAGCMGGRNASLGEPVAYQAS